MTRTSLQASNRRVLIIDDNVSIHEDFRKILGKLGEAEESLSLAEAQLFGLVPNAGPERPVFELSSAYQGEEGIQAVTKSVAAGVPFALAFVDVRMPPGLDGIETTARLWQADSGLQVVICTAYSDYSWNEMIGRLGHSDRLVILKKPFDTAEVLQLASALTEKWALQQAMSRRVDDLETLVEQRTQHLQQSNRELACEVARRVRREDCLRLQNDVARFLADSSAPMEEVIQQVLGVICQSMGWSLGRLWIADSRAGILRCPAALVHRGQSAVSRDSNTGKANDPSKTDQCLAPGCGLAGHVWKQGEPVWVSPNSPNGFALTAPPELLPNALAFPLRLEGSISGVLEFRGTSSPEDDGTLLQGLETIGSLLGHVLERRKLEEQLRHSQKMDAIGHLAGGIAHDFNNILTVINGYGQLLKMKPGTSPDVQACVAQVCLAADRAAMLTRQLLTFSRKQIMQPRSLDLNKLIGQTEAMLRRMIGEDIALKFNPCEGTAAVNADEGMLNQVLMNLACNARDAMPNGGSLTISTAQVILDESSAQRCIEARAGNFISLVVEDSGCGIQPEDLPRIFEPFFTTKDVGRGTGLGLCTVYGIVKQHRGWIEVDSSVGNGTAFRIFMPQTLELRASQVQENAPPAKAGQGETILLVEDEAPVRNLAGQILRSHGYRVVEAGSGVEALAVWEKQAPTIDMLLTDIVMPDGINGRDLALRLRASRVELPVLLVSGYSPREVDRDPLPGSYFLPKPYSPQKLIECIRICLEKASRRSCAELSIAT